MEIFAGKWFVLTDKKLFERPALLDSFTNNTEYRYFFVKLNNKTFASMNEWLIDNK